MILTAAIAASLAQSASPAEGAVPAAPPAVIAPASPPPLTASPLPEDNTVTAPAAAQTPPPAEAPPADPGNAPIVVSGEKKMQKIDPLAGVNKTTFQVIETADKAIIGPIAHGYRKAVPNPVRQGLHNFFFNLTEPVNAVNYVLQLHPGKALKTVARFGVNSTIGVGGLVDVARKKPFSIPYRPNGFANTFGYWGIGPGPYLFLPLVGPTSVRDLIGSLLDQAALPTVIGKPFNNYYFVLSSGLITELDYRVDIDEGVERVRKTSSPYATYRQLYLKSRFEEIEALHGRGPLAKGEIGQPPFVRPLYPEAEPAAVAPAPTPLPPAAAPAPPETPPPAPLPPVFVSHPVVQPLPAGH